jgi:site-specific DNA-methyltransferase (adenine-specific)
MTELIKVQLSRKQLPYVSEFDLDAPGTVAEPTPTSKNVCVIGDRQRGLYLYQANCLELMDLLAEKHPHGCFEMIFADPPYFLSNGGVTCQNGRMVSVNKGAWDRSQGIEFNHAFNLEWLKRCQRLLKPDGTIWVSGTMHIIHSIGFAMQQLGFKMLNDIIWEKPNPPPNLACRYFTHATETILWAAKSAKSKHCFHYGEMKSANGGKQMKSVWRIKPPALREKEFGKHPTQKPVELLKRCIEASTNRGDFVLDPFAGSSTTGIAALDLKRRFCGIESEQEFINLSVKRLAQCR